jgi:uncharacterized protein
MNHVNFILKIAGSHRPSMDQKTGVFLISAFQEGCDMSDPQIEKVALQLSLGEREVQATAELLDGGATLPFIARYRKEATGNLDEVAIARIRDQLYRNRQLEERRDAILHSLAKRELLTPDLQAKLQAADTLAMLEDIYLPFRPKRKTRATAAKERGLEPLAKRIFAQDHCRLNPEKEALAFVDAEKGVASAEEALAGARDIMAEWMSEDTEARRRMRALYQSQGVLRSVATASKEELSEAQAKADAKREEKDAGKFRDYLDWSEPVARTSPHRLLAMLRGAKTGALSLHVAPAEEEGLAVLEELFIKGDGPAAGQVMQAAEDGYRRLLAPSMENETLAAARAHAEEKAIEVFSENLRQVLLDPPLGQKCVLAVDPGLRTGCKLAVLDRLGRLQESHVIYPHDTQKKREEAAARVQEICKKRGIEVIAVGNGTAGRETQAFLQSLRLEPPIMMVNESGASVYSTSEVARQEFPHEDATVRGTVSIGRRLMDPLAELVKIEPNAIGVGQYQHDVDQPALRRALDDVVSSCVNLVGVDVNAASRELLAYVSGLGPKLAEAVVKYRNEHGLFSSRQDLHKVPRLGPKAFEQAAGFLRIRESDNPLDGTAVHPESYPLVEKMAGDLGVSVREMMHNESLLKKLDPKKYISEKAGAATLQDILEELSRPGRDPRAEFEAFCFAPGIEKMEDLKVGMKLPGLVTNVTAFGAFVDIGVHQDGLVHISQLRDGYVKNPTDVVKARQKVTVKVLDVDLERKRISLSMKNST